MLAHRWKKKQQLKKAKCARDHHLAARLALSDVRSRFYRLRRLIFKKKKKKGMLVSQHALSVSPSLPRAEEALRLRNTKIYVAVETQILYARASIVLHCITWHCMALHAHPF